MPGAAELPPAPTPDPDNPPVPHNPTHASLANPGGAGATHWGQQSFFLQPPLRCAAGDRVDCELELTRRRDNQRLLEVAIKMKVWRGVVLLALFIFVCVGGWGVAGWVHQRAGAHPAARQPL